MQDPMSIIRFLPRFHAVATLGTDNSIAIWDLDQPSLQTPWRELKGHMSTIHSISFSPDGTTMMSAGNDQMVISWDVSDLHAISMLSQLAVFESVKSVLPLSKTACVTGGDKGRIRIWKDRKCVCDIPSGHAAEGHLNFLYCLPTTGELLSVGADLGMSVWTKPASMKTEFSRQLMGNMGELLAMKWLPGGERVVVAVNDEYPRIIDTRNFSAVSKMVGHSDIVLCVAVGRDMIATGSKDQTVRVWDPNTLECVSEMLGHTGPVNAVAFTRREDGEGVRVVSGSEDNSIKIWRAVNKKSSKKLIIRSIMAHSKPVNAVVVSKNDKWVATGSQDRSAKIFNIDDGSLVATCTGHKGSIWGVDFSPIEQILATSSRDGTVKLWNLAAPGAPCIRTFEGHEQSVMACRFLSNGLQLISADSLGTMRLWNVRTGECPLIALIDGETISTSSEKRKDAKAAETKALEDFAESETTAKIWTIDITQEEGGKLKVVSGTNNGTMNVWTDNTQELVEARKKQISENAEKDTSIQVLVKAGKYADAFRNAFALNRPKIMLEVVREALWREDKAGRVNVGRFVTENVIDEKSAQKLMAIAQEWQKTAKTCAIAYQIVEAAVRHASTLIPETAIDVSKFEGFAEKHLARLTSLSQKCYIIDAILLASNAANIEQS
jgi:U3 small nucleolar RNA-associated protein 13